MEFSIDPLMVTCDTCGKSAETYDYGDPDGALDCDCCPVKHNHGGLGCRTVTITASAFLQAFSLADLLGAEEPAIEPADVLFLVHRVAGGAGAAG